MNARTILYLRGRARNPRWGGPSLSNMVHIMDINEPIWRPRSLCRGKVKAAEQPAEQRPPGTKLCAECKGVAERLGLIDAPSRSTDEEAAR